MSSLQDRGIWEDEKAEWDEECHFWQSEVFGDNTYQVILKISLDKKKQTFGFHTQDCRLCTENKGKVDKRICFKCTQARDGI